MNSHALAAISAAQFVFLSCSSNTATADGWIFLQRGVVLRRGFLQVLHDLHRIIFTRINFERKPVRITAH
jgi:hypothetical protein